MPDEFNFRVCCLTWNLHGKLPSNGWFLLLFRHMSSFHLLIFDLFFGIVSEVLTELLPVNRRQLVQSQPAHLDFSQRSFPPSSLSPQIFLLLFLSRSSEQLDILTRGGPSISLPDGVWPQHFGLRRRRAEPNASASESQSLEYLAQRIAAEDDIDCYSICTQECAASIEKSMIIDDKSKFVNELIAILGPLGYTLIAQQTLQAIHIAVFIRNVCGC